jgi:hypothetical protein
MVMEVMEARLPDERRRRAPTPVEAYLLSQLEQARNTGRRHLGPDEDATDLNCATALIRQGHVNLAVMLLIKRLHEVEDEIAQRRAARPTSNVVLVAASEDGERND